MNTRYTFICENTVIDPDTDDAVPIEIWKDNVSGGIFGIESPFLDQVGRHHNPYTGELQDLPEPN